MATTPPDFDDYILLSMLEHYSYCPRQCALIHREQTYDENVYTLQGNAVHERVDQPGVATVAGVRTEYGVPLWSESLGLLGKGDLVEFHGATPYPVEYKHGPARYGRHADLQLCGQAMCLEEMLGVDVPTGAVYHFSSRQRREVEFTASLRTQVRETVSAIRQMLSASTLPPAVADARCKNCSLVESCLPFVVSEQRRNRNYQRQLFMPATNSEEPHGP